MMTIQDRGKLRRVIKLGSSVAVTLPASWVEGWSYAWIERHDGLITLRRAEVS
jgi:hypothetical protein